MSERKKCLICGNTSLIEQFDLGIHPFADTFVANSDLTKQEFRQNLVGQLCHACSHSQLKFVTNPSERYIDTEYSYTSSNSSYARDYWKSFANDVLQRTSVNKGQAIIEIGSNDGYLLSLLKDDYKVIGIDASPTMCEIARRSGVESINAIFDKETANRIKSRGGPVEIIIANNVVNHSENPVNFTMGVCDLLSEDGWFVFEVPYWKNTVLDQKFDQIYHEHVSYFTARSAIKLCAEASLSVKILEVSPYHGGSLRVFAQRSKSKAHDSVNQLLNTELKENLDKAETYEKFCRDINRKKYSFLSKLYKLKSEGKRIACAGAAAKSNTFINFYGLNRMTIDFVTDASEHKIGKSMPLTRIPILSDDALRGNEEIFVIITSWNIADLLKSKLLPLNPKIKFLNPYE